MKTFEYKKGDIVSFSDTWAADLGFVSSNPRNLIGKSLVVEDVDSNGMIFVSKVWWNPSRVNLIYRPEETQPDKVEYKKPKSDDVDLEYVWILVSKKTGKRSRATFRTRELARKHKTPEYSVHRVVAILRSDVV